MKKIKSTPGPWVIKKNGLTNIIGTDETDVADVHWCHKKDGKANASLIAVAPELLEALIKWLKKFYDFTQMAHIKNSKYQHEYVEHFYKEHKEDLGLIKKATGLEWEDIIK